MNSTFSSFFFFNDTATTEIYTLSLHDALPIWVESREQGSAGGTTAGRGVKLGQADAARGDRKSTRLNSSHQIISYAVFCLKKKINSVFAVKNIPFSIISPTATYAGAKAIPSGA